MSERAGKADFTVESGPIDRVGGGR